jgi:preprotein translocase subunit SecB
LRDVPGGWSRSNAIRGFLMTDTNATEDAGSPTINVLAQYLKDLSFESPNAPASLAPSDENPQLSINVNVGARPVSATEFEVELTLQGRATRGDSVVFAVETVYAGFFRVTNVPEEHLHPFILIECPRLLFPFARQIIADASRNGGFPPLMIDPIDFVALYQQNLARQAQESSQIN